MKLFENETINNEFLTAIINNSFEAIVSYKPVRNNQEEIVDFIFQYLNEPALKLLNGPREKFLYNSFLTLFPYAAEDGMFEMFRSVIEKGEPLEETFYYEYGEYKGWYRDSAVKYKDGLLVYFREVTLQKQLELELKKAVSEKDILLKETHHRVKNNFQIISSLLNLQANKYVSTEFIGTCQTCVNRIKTISDIHQTLYEDDDFESIDMKKFIEEVVSSIRSKVSVNIKYEVDDIKINLNAAIGVGLIIYELLTNSISHAFNNGESDIIIITVKESFPDLIITISDNGKGLPPGFNINRIESLGLILVQTVASQLDGKIEINSTDGTQFILTLPNLIVNQH